ncbi:MAG: hypothetical protein V9H69_12025 [Anaerolineae bacterium]
MRRRISSAVEELPVLGRSGGPDRYGPQPLGQRQPARVQVHGKDGQRAQRPRQLDGRHAQPADAKDGHALAGRQPPFAQRVQRRGRGAHHHRALLEGDLLRQGEDAARRQDDIFGIAAVAVLADHLPSGAELLRALAAVDAVAAGGQIVQADPVARPPANLPARPPAPPRR